MMGSPARNQAYLSGRGDPTDHWRCTTFRRQSRTSEMPTDRAKQESSKLPETCPTRLQPTNSAPRHPCALRSGDRGRHVSLARF